MITMNKTENSLKDITEEIENLFDHYNKNLFESELIRPIITIQSGNVGKRKSNGWFINSIWTDSKNKINEINISAEILSARTKLNNIPQVAVTLLHEMIHVYCFKNNIQDTARNGNHNKKTFGFHAENKGLICEYIKTFPMIRTPDLNQDGLRVYNDFNFDESLLNKFRIGFYFPDSEKDPDSENDSEDNEDKPIKKPKLKNLFCPGCNIKAYVAYGLETPLVCGECNETLLEQVK